MVAETRCIPCACPAAWPPAATVGRRTAYPAPASSFWRQCRWGTPAARRGIPPGRVSFPMRPGAGHPAPREKRPAGDCRRAAYCLFISRAGTQRAACASCATSSPLMCRKFSLACRNFPPHTPRFCPLRAAISPPHTPRFRPSCAAISSMRAHFRSMSSTSRSCVRARSRFCPGREVWKYVSPCR